MSAARIVSLVFHPLLLTTYLVLLFGKWFPGLLLAPGLNYLQFTLFVFAFTFVIPALNMYIFKRFGLIQSLTLQSRQERVMPFIFNTIIYLTIAFLFVYKVPISTTFTRLMLIVAALAVTGTICTFFFKISVHSLGWAGLVGMVTPFINVSEGRLLVPTAIVVVITGAVMSARLKLDAHAPAEVWAGCVAGFLVGFGGVLYLFSAV